MDPIFYQISERQFLYHDLFISNDRFCIVYHDYGKNVDRSTLKIYLNNVELVKYGIAEYNGTTLRYYDLKDVRAKNELRITWNDVTIRHTLKPVTPRHHKMCIATLFKDDYSWIETFYQYYKKQGVDYFYLWYNGDIEIVRDKLFQADDIEYGSWNFHYWDSPNKHHAQVPCLLTFQYKYFPYTDYASINDLDEFITGPDTTIYDYCKTINFKVLTVANYWSRLSKSDERSKGTMELLVTEKSTGSQRRKAIYRSDFNDVIGIHGPTDDRAPRYVDKTLIMCHIIDVIHPERKNLIVNPRKLVL